MSRLSIAWSTPGIIALILGSALLTTPLWAASVYTYTSTGNNQSQDTIELLIDGPNLSMDDKVQGGMLFRSTEEYMALIDHRKRQFVHLSLEQMEQLAAQVNPALEAMRQQMEKLPPEQQEMMKKMMESRAPQMQKESRKIEATLKATGKQGNFAGYDCEWFEMRQESELLRSACVAKTSAIPNGATSRETLHSMAAYQKKLFAAFENMPMSPSTTIFEEIQNIDGFPIATRDFNNGILDYESRLSSTAERDASDEDFEPPDGYTERPLANQQ